MTARPPPARPHIALHSSFNTKGTADWGEDDVWDSASDAESPRQSTITHSWRPPPKQQPSQPPTAPRPVPKKSRNSSSSTLALSYTHVSVPSPSSYPKMESPGQSSKEWTMVRKPSIPQNSTDGKLQVNSTDVHEDADLDADMVIGDFEPEIGPAAGPKARPPQGSVKSDAEEVVNGIKMFPLSPNRSECLDRSISQASRFPSPAGRIAIWKRNKP